MHEIRIGKTGIVAAISPVAAWVRLLLRPEQMSAVGRPVEK